MYVVCDKSKLVGVLFGKRGTQDGTSDIAGIREGVENWEPSVLLIRDKTIHMCVFADTTAVATSGARNFQRLQVTLQAV